MQIAFQPQTRTIDVEVTLVAGLVRAPGRNRVPTPRRQEIHERLAATAQDAEERARHLALARREPDETAAAVLEEEARSAFRRGAPDAAAELMDQARRLTPPNHLEAWHRRTADAATYHLQSGRTAHARRLVEESIRTLPAGPARARALFRVAGILRISGDLGEGLRTMEEALIESGEDLTLRMRCHRGVAVLAEDADPVRTTEHAKEAVALARRTGDDVGLAEALVVFGSSMFLTGRGVQEDAAEEAFEVARKAEWTQLYGHPAVQHAEVLMWADRLGGR